MKTNLTQGNIVQLRRGDYYLVYNDGNLIPLTGDYHKRKGLSHYDDNGKRTDGVEKWDIVAVYSDYTLVDAIWDESMIVPTTTANPTISKEEELIALIKKVLNVA